MEPTSGLGPIELKRRGGDERFRDGAHDLGFQLAEFWQWSSSDLVSNATRGILAEYLVAKALGVADGVRDEWAPYDLTTAEGTRVEVKSAAYIQSWYQKKLSVISFHVPKTRAWDRESNLESEEARRQADVYVFALLAHQEQATLDPLDIAQWEFFVLPTARLDSRTRSQHSIMLKSLQALAGQSVGFSGLRGAVAEAAALQRELANAAMQTNPPSAGG